MKTIVAAVTFLILSTQLVSAQRGEDHERIEALRIAYITERLEITPSEAQVFWPVFNEFDKKVRDARDAERKLKEQIASQSTITNAEELLNQLVSLEQQDADLLKQYTSQMTEILGAEKVVRLLSLDHEFRKDLFRKMRSKRKS